MKANELLEQAKRAPQSLSFAQLRQLAEAFGFALDRISASHYIYKRDEIAEVLSFQRDKKNKKSAKSYQVRQLLKLIEQYKLTPKE